MARLTASDFCSVASRERGEPMIGTAVARTSVWLGVELEGPWPRDAFRGEAVPSALSARLREWTAAVDGFRAQALRRPGRRERPAAYLAVTEPGRETLVELELASLAELARFDLEAAVEQLRRGALPATAVRVEVPAVWVCVHGKRDRCCAKFGAPVYQAAVDEGAAQVWQTSHLGGHRFAATLLCLPYGVCYGRVTPADVPALLRASARGDAYDLDRLRGRTCWSAAEQAAVHFVLSATGHRAWASVAVESQNNSARGVEVGVRVGSQGYSVVVEQRPAGGFGQPSCDKPATEIRGWSRVALAER